MAVAPSNIASGTCGTCTWGIMHDGTLVVSQGTLGLAAFSTWPWLAYASDITRVDMTPSISAGPTCDEMFKDCVNLVEADLSGLDVSSSSSAMMMFYGCSSLERLDVSMWNVGRMVAVAGMFLECGTNDLVLDLSSWDTSGIANSSALFTTYGDPDATAYLGNRSFTGGRIVTGAGWTLEAALPPQNYGTGDTYTWHDTTGWRTAISECYRCDSSGNAKPDGGEYVKAGATWSIGTTGSAITQTSSGKHDYIRDDVMSGLSMTGTVEILDPSTSSIFTGTLVASGTPAIIAASTNELEVTISLTDGSVTVEHYAAVPSGTPPVLSAHKSDGMVDGLGLGASYKEGYVNNGFPHAILGQPVPPTFYYSTKPAESDLPVTPCIVIQTSDWSVWYADGTDYHQLNADKITGVKGNAETTYRTGDVNLTPENIGALNKAGDTMTGLLKFNSDSLPGDGASTDFYATGINAFSNGGRLAYKNVSDFRLWLETPRRFSFGNAGNTATYSIFARTSNNNPTGNCQATFLVSAVSSYGATVEGTYLVEVTNRGSTPTITVRCLMGIVGGNAIRFGYYRSGNYFYFGVYNPNYSGSLFFTELSNTNVTTGVLSRPSSAPSGWTPVYAGSSIAPDVLYENSSGSNGTVTLSASAANYNHMRIHFRSNDGTAFVSAVDVYSPNGKRPNLVVVYDNGSNWMYFKAKTVYINGTSIANNGTGYGEAWVGSGSCGRTNANNVYITRVEAWNE